MNRDNPFPGMNPFLERHWPDVHTKLIAYIADALAEKLPPELNARSEEKVTLHSVGESDAILRADVAVVESWKRGIPPKWEPEKRDDEQIVATVPKILIVPEDTDRWINISDLNGKLITVIEVLSPSNKGTQRNQYLARRECYLQGSINLVEIDLLREGTPTFPTSSDAPHIRAQAKYYTCVSRAHLPGRLELYETPLPERLPNVSIPLRPTDPDIVLALQPLVDRCHRMGGYWSTNYRDVPGPPLTAEEQEWVSEMLLTAQMVS